MPSDPTHSASRALTEWLQRNDWALYERATTAVETESAFKDGVSVVKKSQLRAVVNTARMCSTPSQFRGFLDKRRERRERAARKRDKKVLEQKAQFWKALKSHLNEIEEQAAEAAEHAGVPDTGRDAAKMGVVRTYFEHLVSHCQVTR